MYTFEQQYFLDDTYRDIEQLQNISDDHFIKWLRTHDNKELSQYHETIDLKHEIIELRSSKIREWRKNDTNM